ncbi:MAG: MBL fold metallo-hydrolase [Oscillospiraceae bacterium]|nr:MBL fold metallo-hydrolase [Oscillospiraceae bacterium]
MPDMGTPQPLEVRKIDETTYSIEDNGVRCMFFIGNERALLVDTGFGQAGSLKAAIAPLTSKPVMLVITHADPDHIGNIQEFDAVYMHPSEMSYYAQNAVEGLEVRPLWEGDTIDIGGRVFDVVHIPGHTNGSIALLDKANRVIATGDTISAGPVFMFGEGRSILAYMASMHKLIGMKALFDSIYPAHGPSPLQGGQIDKALAAAEKLVAGELAAVDPPFPIPAKMYMDDGVGFFY